MSREYQVLSWDLQNSLENQTNPQANVEKMTLKLSGQLSLEIPLLRIFRPAPPL